MQLDDNQLRIIDFIWTKSTRTPFPGNQRNKINQMNPKILRTILFSKISVKDLTYDRTISITLFGIRFCYIFS